MKVLKNILHVLAIVFGGILSLQLLIALFANFDALTKATGAYEVSYQVMYLIFTIAFGWLFVWIFWRGISFFIKKPQLTKAEIEKKIEDIDK